VTRQELLTGGSALILLGHLNFLPLSPLPWFGFFQSVLGIGFIVAWFVRFWREDG
jgi:hypothetical protein